MSEATAKPDASFAPDIAEEEKHSRKNWLPLESDPGLMTKYLHKLGAPNVAFSEVFGFDPDVLAFVPQPVHAVMMLFPVSEASEAHRKEEHDEIVQSGKEYRKDIYWMRQTVGNACGTIGLIHTVANTMHLHKIEEGKFFDKFINGTKDHSGIDRAGALEANQDIEEEHQDVAAEAGTDPAHEAHHNLHFISFVVIDGHMYELDGRKEGPIDHGKCDNLLQDAVEVAKKFMARDPKDHRFNLVALVDADNV